MVKIRVCEVFNFEESNRVAMCVICFCSVCVHFYSLVFLCLRVVIYRKIMTVHCSKSVMGKLCTQQAVVVVEGMTY